jgi:hypothetical protein
MERPPWIRYLGCSASVAALLVAEVEQARPGSDSNSSDTGCVWLFLSTYPTYLPSHLSVSSPVDQS